MSDPRVKSSDYLHWAKTRSESRFNLASSGMLPCTVSDLEVSLDTIEISGPALYGYEPLQEALARKCGVKPENVVAATGTSMANHLAMAILIDPGDEVVIEHPAYEPLPAVASYLGATIKRFPRRFEDGFRVEVGEIEKVVTPRTRLIVLTNLHNPSSAFIDEATLRRVGELALDAGAKVLVDEVYLEAMFDRAPRSAFHLGSQFVTTSSLTKAYGLSGLRCGWVLAEPDLAERIWRLNDLFGVVPAHAAQQLSVIALARLDRLADRARAVLERNRPLLNSFLDSRQDLESLRPEFGTVIFPKLRTGSVDGLCSLLRDKYETTVVHGRHFEMPDNFRLGICVETGMLEQGLERLGAALDELDKKYVATS
jgi:aspartate/methionine/tyrosine aminotransferase